MLEVTDNGHPERAFFQKFESFGLGQTNWAEIFGCILIISSQTIGTILALWLWVSCSWESVAGSFSYKKCWFLSLKHITPKYSQNKILAVENLEKSLRTSVFGVWSHFYKFFVVLKYHRRPWVNVFDTDISRCINTYIKSNKNLCISSCPPPLRFVDLPTALL